jgi:6-phosphogluconolactonase
MRLITTLLALLSVALVQAIRFDNAAPLDLDIAVNSSANAYYFVGGYNPFVYVVQVPFQAPNAISVVGKFNSANSASFLSLQGNTLVAVNELESFLGVPNTGGITSFKVKASNGRLQVQKVNSVPSKGNDPAFVTLVQTKNRLNVLAANYGGGNYGSFAINADGSVSGNPTSFFTDSGSGPNKGRQASPHPHQIIPDLNKKFVFVPDLGTDHIMQYVLNDDGSLTPNPKAPSVSVIPGSGPRHAAFHPSGKWAFVTTELASRMDVYSYAQSTGTLQYQTGYNMLGPDVVNPSSSTAAEVKIPADGKFVYGSNRNGSDSIVIFKVDVNTGALSPVGWEKTRGQIPRFFTLTNLDKWLFVANQNSNNLVLFSRDANTGKLTYLSSSQAGAIIQPTCIVHVKTN